MSAKADLPVWYAVDEDGDYAVGIDREIAIDAYYSEFDGTITRVFKVIAKGVTLVPCVEVEVVVPDQAGEIESAGVEQLDCPAA